MAPLARAGGELLVEAADWLVTPHHGDPTGAERDAFDTWRLSSPADDAARRRVSVILERCGQLPPNVGHRALSELTEATSAPRLLL